MVSTVNERCIILRNHVNRTQEADGNRIICIQRQFLTALVLDVQTYVCSDLTCQIVVGLSIQQCLRDVVLLVNNLLVVDVVESKHGNHSAVQSALLSSDKLRTVGRDRCDIGLTVSTYILLTSVLGIEDELHNQRVGSRSMREGLRRRTVCNIQVAGILQVVANEEVARLDCDSIAKLAGISLLDRQNLSVNLVLASATSSHIGTVPPVGNLLVVPNHLCRRLVHLHISRLTLVLEHDVEVGESNLSVRGVLHGDDAVAGQCLGLGVHRLGVLNKQGLCLSRGQCPLEG